MATLGGARALRLEHRIGSLEVGKAADLVIRSPALAEVQPGLDPVQAVVLSGRGRSVDTVLVDGRIVLKDGRSTVVDEETVHAEARASAARLMARLGLHPSRRWRWVD